MKPTEKQIAGPKEGSPTYEEADSFKYILEVSHELGGLIIVKYDNVYYVCYGSDYFKGYDNEEFIVME
jgi:hypothetical protein